MCASASAGEQCRVSDVDVANPSAASFYDMTGSSDRCLSDPAVTQAECQAYATSISRGDRYSPVGTTSGKPKACYTNNAGNVRWNPYSGSATSAAACKSSFSASCVCAYRAWSCLCPIHPPSPPPPAPSPPPPPPPASQPLPDYAYGEGDGESDDDGLPLIELRAEADTQDLAASNVTLDGFVEAIEASATVFGDEPVKVQVSQVDVMFYGVEGEEVIDRQDRRPRTQTPLSRIVTPPPPPRWATRHSRRLSAKAGCAASIQRARSSRSTIPVWESQFETPLPLLAPQCARSTPGYVGAPRLA